MKALVHIVQVSVCMSLLIASPAKTRAQEEQNEPPVEKKKSSVMFGGAVYYAGWAPFWRTEHATGFNGAMFIKLDGQYTLKSMTPVYVPLLAFTFNERWGLSFSALTGKFEFSYNGTSINGIMGQPTTTNNYTWIRYAEKYDGDILANYNMLQHIKIFFGLKYQGYEYRNKGLNAVGPFLMPISESASLYTGGIGLGVMATLPLAGGLYLQTQLSFQALGGVEVRAGAKQVIVNLGGNAVAGFAYHIKAAHITIALGGRMQFQYYLKSLSLYQNSPTDQFYGAYGSLVLVF